MPTLLAYTSLARTGSVEAVRAEVEQFYGYAQTFVKYVFSHLPGVLRVHAGIWVKRTATKSLDERGRDAQIQAMS